MNAAAVLWCSKTRNQGSGNSFNWVTWKKPSGSLSAKEGRLQAELQLCQWILNPVCGIDLYLHKHHTGNGDISPDISMMKCNQDVWKWLHTARFVDNNHWNQTRRDFLHVQLAISNSVLFKELSRLLSFLLAIQLSLLGYPGSMLRWDWKEQSWTALVDGIEE